MREIKFRAWDKDNKEMFEPVIPFGDSVYKTVVIGIEEDRSYLAKIENAEIMQFTGLKDKNGVEIYEGDVVREQGNDYTPIYQNGVYMAYNVDKINDPYVSTQFNVIWRNGCKVVGNIHDQGEAHNENA